MPLSIIVLLPVEDLLLFAYRQPDPAFGHVQSEVRVPSSGGSKEQQTLSSPSPDVQRKVGPGEVKETFLKHTKLLFCKLLVQFIVLKL